MWRVPAMRCIGSHHPMRVGSPRFMPAPSALHSPMTPASAPAPAPAPAHSSGVRRVSTIRRNIPPPPHIKTIPTHRRHTPMTMADHATRTMQLNSPLPNGPALLNSSSGDGGGNSGGGRMWRRIRSIPVFRLLLLASLCTFLYESESLLESFLSSLRSAYDSERLRLEHAHYIQFGWPNGENTRVGVEETPTAIRDGKQYDRDDMNEKDDKDDSNDESDSDADATAPVPQFAPDTPFDPIVQQSFNAVQSHFYIGKWYVLPSLQRLVTFLLFTSDRTLRVPVPTVEASKAGGSPPSPLSPPSPIVGWFFRIQGLLVEFLMLVPREQARIVDQLEQTHPRRIGLKSLRKKRLEQALAFSQHAIRLHLYGQTDLHKFHGLNSDCIDLAIQLERWNLASPMIVQGRKRLVRELELARQLSPNGVMDADDACWFREQRLRYWTSYAELFQRRGLHLIALELWLVTLDLSQEHRRKNGTSTDWIELLDQPKYQATLEQFLYIYTQISHCALRLHTDTTEEQQRKTYARFVTRTLPTTIDKSRSLAIAINAAIGAMATAEIIAHHGFHLPAEVKTGINSNGDGDHADGDDGDGGGDDVSGDTIGSHTSSDPYRISLTHLSSALWSAKLLQIMFRPNDEKANNNDNKKVTNTNNNDINGATTSTTSTSNETPSIDQPAEASPPAPSPSASSSLPAGVDLTRLVSLSRNFLDTYAATRLSPCILIGTRYESFLYGSDPTKVGCDYPRYLPRIRHGGSLETLKFEANPLRVIRFQTSVGGVYQQLGRVLKSQGRHEDARRACDIARQATKHAWIERYIKQYQEFEDDD